MMASGGKIQPLGDPALPGLERACDPRRLHPLLQGLLQTLPGRSASRFAACHLRYFKWKPGTSAYLAYELEKPLGSGKTGASEWILGKLLTAVRAQELRDSLSSRATGSSVPGDPDGLLEELPMAVWVLPNEPRIRHLATAMDGPLPRRAAGSLFPDLLEEGFRPQGHVVSSEIFRYKPGNRCLVRLRVTFGNSRSRAKTHRSIFCRVYADPAGAVHAHETMEALAARRDDLGKSLLLAVPTWIDAGRGILYQPEMAGSPLLQDGGTPEISSVVRSLGRGLAHLHALPLAPVLHRDIAEEIGRLQKAMGGLQACGEPLAARARSLLQKLERKSMSLDAWPMVPIHGDLHPAQLLAQGRRAVLVDFDQFCLGDPLADLAGWEAHILSLACRGILEMGFARLLTDPLCRAWRAETAKLGVGSRPELAFERHRYAWHLAAALFRLAESPYRELQPDAPLAAARLLSASERILRRVPGKQGRRAAGWREPPVRPPQAPSRSRGQADSGMRARLRAALDPSIYRREVGSLFQDSGAGWLAFLRVKQVWPIRETLWHVLYELRVRSGRKLDRTWAYLRLGTGPDEHDPTAAAGKSRRFGQAGDRLRLFPEDPVLHALPRALDGARVAHALQKAKLCDPFTIPDPAVTIEREVLSYRPEHRCTIRYRLRAQPGREFVGKLFPSRIRVENTGAILESIHDAFGGNGDSPALSSAASLPQLRLILFPEVPGRTLYDLLAGEASGGRTTSEQEMSALERLMDRAGRAAASFHRPAPFLGRQFDLAAERELLRFWIRASQVLYPAQALASARLFEQLQRRMDDCVAGERPRRLLHRDLYDKQFLFDGERVRILDLDTACLGDPALDVGNFLAHLKLRSLQHHGRSDAYEPLRRAFFQAYRGEAHPEDAAPDFLERSRLYEATALLRLSVLYLLRPHRTSIFYPLLHEARLSMEPSATR